MDISSYTIINYINYNDYIQLHRINIDTFNKLKIIPIHIKEEFYCKKLKYPIELINMIGPSILFNIKEIDIKDRKGWTDYIDFININDFNNSNLIRGIDIFNRPFISILYTINNNPNPKILTIFQRYSDYKNKYAAGGNHFPGFHISAIYFDNTRYDNEILNILIKLIKYSKVSYNFIEWHSNINKTINLQLWEHS